jgi:serine/threonine protein kinase
MVDGDPEIEDLVGFSTDLQALGATSTRTSRLSTPTVALSAALGQLHARGLIHKDIKPAHVLVNASTSQVWLTGFDWQWQDCKTGIRASAWLRFGTCSPTGPILIGSVCWTTCAKHHYPKDKPAPEAKLQLFGRSFSLGGGAALDGGTQI